MKHVVELKYTNPSHEHVSLRRRVETVNRVVEAQSADEALNRAANQQRSLGFRIQSANIVEQKIEESTSALISEETELEEGKIAKALAVGAMALASMGAKAHTDTTKSVAQLAQVVFNKYIRLRDKDKPCVSCDKPLGSKYDAGHYFSSGGHKAVTFDENNVHGQCVTCNQHKHGNLLILVVQVRLFS